MTATLRNATPRPMTVPFASFPIVDENGQPTGLVLRSRILQPGDSAAVDDPPTWILDQLEAHGFTIEKETP